MKKLFVFLLICLLLCVAGTNFVKGLNIEDIFSNCNIEVYLPQNDVINELHYIKNGDGAVVFGDTSDLDYILKNFKVAGFTIKVKSLEIETLLKKIRATNITCASQGIYGYSHELPDIICASGLKTNFQCVQVEDYLLLGVPILLGCY